MAEPIGALYADLRMPTARFENDLRAAAAAVRGASNKMEAGFDKLSSKVNSWGGNLTRFGLAYAAFWGGISTLRGITGEANELQKVDTQLKFLIADSTKVKETQTYLSQTSARLNVDILTLSRSYAGLLPLVNNNTITTDQARKITEGYANAQHAMGLANGTVAASMVGLSQALSAGVVHMQDFRQVTGQIPGLAQKVAAAMGLSFGQLYQDIGKAKIGSQAFGDALVKAFEGYAGAATAAEGTINAAQNSINTSWLRIVATLKGPVSRAMTSFAEALNGVANAVDKLAAAGSLKSTFDFGTNLESNRARVADLRKQIADLQASGDVVKIRQEFAKLNNEVNRLEARDPVHQLMVLNQQIATVEKARGIAAANQASALAALKAQRAALAGALAPAPNISLESLPKPGATPALNQVQITAKAITDEQQRLYKSSIETFQATRTPAEQYLAQLKSYKQQLDANYISQDTYNRAVGDLNEKYLPEIDITLTKLKPALDGASQASKQLGDNLVQAFENAILSGQGLLKTMARLIESAVLFGSNGRGGLLGGLLNNIATGISGGVTKIFGGGRAGGGPVYPGTAYLVGERGPEIFSPSVPGSIAPNGALGGQAAIHISVDARGSTNPAEVDARVQAGIIAAAPSIVGASRKATHRDFTRPSIA